MGKRKVSDNPGRWNARQAGRQGFPTDKHHAAQAKPPVAKGRVPALVTSTPAVLTKRGS